MSCTVRAAALNVSGNFGVLIRFGITGTVSKLFGLNILALRADMVRTVVLSIKTIFRMYVPGSANVSGVVVTKFPVNGWRPR